MSIHERIERLVALGLSPAKTIALSSKVSGRAVVGCLPVITPDEIMHAAGYLPVGMWGGQVRFKLADSYLQSFACSVMRATVELAIRGTYKDVKAIFVPTICDTLKCVLENMKVILPETPVIGVTYPQHRGIPAGRKHMLAELERVRAEVAKLAGAEITDDKLAKSVAVYDAFRKAMAEFLGTAAKYPALINAKARHYIIKASYFMEKAEYTAEIEALTQALREQPHTPFDGLRVITTGVMADSEPLLDLMAELNVAVVGDLMLHESIQHCRPQSFCGSPIEQMADRFLQMKGCSVFYEPAKTRGQILIDKARETGADAVLCFLMKFCDPEEFDLPVYMAELKQAGVKMLQVEIDQQVDSVEQIRTRLQSFAEMLSI